MNEKVKKNCEVSAILSSIIAVILWYKFSYSKKNGTIIYGTMNANLLAFVGISCVFVCSFFLFLMIGWLCRKWKINTRIYDIGAIAVLGFVATCLVWQYFTETDLWPRGSAGVYIRHNIPWQIYFLILLILFILIRRSDIAFMLDVKNRMIVCIFLSIITAICQYCPNAFYDRGGYIYHYDAYTNSIFNVLNGNAYSDINISIYGHYGIIYSPIVKLLGGNTFAVARAISVVTFITVLCAELALMKIIKDEKIFVLSALAIPVSFVMMHHTGVYNQVAPHRYLFPAILIWYVIWKKWDFTEKWKNMLSSLIGWGICVLAIIWNTETGLFCTVGYAAFLFYLYAEQQQKICGKLLLKFVELVVWIVFTFFIAYEIVNFYNILAGGHTISIRTYIYPMLADEYNINELIVMVPFGISFYIFEILTFLITGCIAIVNNRVFTNQEDDATNKWAVVLMTALIGMGCFSYYINRTVYCNMSISHIEFVLLAGIACEELMIAGKHEKSEKILKVSLAGGLSQIIMMILLAMTVGTITYTGYNMMNKVESSWKSEELILQTQDVAAEVPADTFAFGKGVNLIYGLYGWNTGCATIDFEDMNTETLAYITEAVQQKDGFFAENEAVSMLQDLDLSLFEQKGTYNICGVDYVYYVRK